MFWCLLNTVIVIQAAKYINVIIIFRCRIFLWKLLLISKESFTDTFTIASVCKLMCICIHVCMRHSPPKTLPLRNGNTTYWRQMAVHCFYVHPSRPYIIGGMPSTFRTITVGVFFIFVLEFFPPFSVLAKKDKVDSACSELEFLDLGVCRKNKCEELIVWVKISCCAWCLHRYSSWFINGLHKWNVV